MKLYTKISIGLISGAVVGIGVNLTDWAVLTESSRTRHASYRGPGILIPLAGRLQYQGRYLG